MVFSKHPYPGLKATHMVEYNISFNRIQSTLLKTNSGVPQGSILGPLLFLSHMNDLTNVTATLNTVIFADDTNLFFSHSNCTELISIINFERTKISDWLKANRLSLNLPDLHNQEKTP